MAFINKALLAAAVALGFAASEAGAVTCACEHYGTANDGICEAQPAQEEMSTLYTYNQYLLGATSSHQVPRYQYTFENVGGAQLQGNAQRYSEFAIYRCSYPQSCTLRVTVHQYADGSMIAGMQSGGYPTYIGETVCEGGTVGEGNPR